MDYLANDDDGADEDNDNDAGDDDDEYNEENGEDGNLLTSQQAAAEDMDYLTGLNPCRRYNQTTTSGQMIFYIFIFLYLCFIFYILYFYIYTSSFYDQCRRYNQTKTSGQIFDVSLKVSHFNHTWPFFIGTLFAGSKPCTCLNWRLKASSD